MENVGRHKDINLTTTEAKGIIYYRTKLSYNFKAIIISF